MKKGRRKSTDGMSDAEFARESNGVLTVGTDTSSGMGKRFRGIFDGRGISSIFKTVKTFTLKHRLLILRAILPALYCLLFGGTKSHMGIYPFGIAAVCAAVSGRNAFFAAVGTVVSSLFVRGGFIIAAVSVTVSILLFLVHKIAGVSVSESTVLRAALSMIAGAAGTVFFFLSDGIGFYGLCAVLLSAVFCPVLTVSLKGIFTADGRMTPAVEGGVYVIFYTLTYFLRSVSPAGESAATVISILGVLFTAYSFGMLKSVMLGVAAGFAASPEYSFIYAAAAVGSGVLVGVSPIAAVLGGTMLALAFGIYSGGAYAFGDLFPELMFSAAVAAPLIHYRLLPVFGRKKGSDRNDETYSVITSAKLRATKKRLTALSESLSAISAVMKKLSAAMHRPSFDEMRQMCDDAFDESCQFCDGRRLCWDREYRSTAAAINSMASVLRKGVAVDEGSLTEGMRNRCAHTNSIISRINLGAHSAMRTAHGDPAVHLADDYGVMSDLIGEIADGTGEDLEYDPAASHALAVRFENIGLRAEEIFVYGKRRRRVFARVLGSGCSAGNDEIRAAAVSVLGCPMSSPEYRIDGGCVMMNLYTAARFSVSIGRCSLAKRGEKCGDSITSFKGDGGYFYSLISDGMGSGSEASLTSSVSAVFLERMLSAGASLTSAMEMLNSFLSRRNMECFTTVDLMEADLITGELRFVKSGAAPSFVLRDGRLFRLESKTVPIGIVTPFDAEQIRFTAKAGDFVVMLSDGAVPDGEECSWLYDLLCGADSEPYLISGADLDFAAREIANRAAEEYGFSDDVTVGIAEIREV